MCWYLVLKVKQKVGRQLICGGIFLDKGNGDYKSARARGIYVAAFAKR